MLGLDKGHSFQRISRWPRLQSQHHNLVQWWPPPLRYWSQLPSYEPHGIRAE
jgi:hypothetical protein